MDTKIEKNPTTGKLKVTLDTDALPEDSLAEQFQTALMNEKDKQDAEIAEGKTTVMMLSPDQYSKVFGNTLDVYLNGVIFTIPIDGKPHKVPNRVAVHAQRIMTLAGR